MYVQIWYMGTDVKIRGLKIGQPFLVSSNIIIDYYWLTHWKCTVNLCDQIRLCLVKW